MIFSSFRHYTIKNKLTVIIMLAASVGLLLASISISAYDVYRFKREMKNELIQLSEIIGYSCTAALIFDDPTTAIEALQALQVKKNIIGAEIYQNGQLFASYKRNGAEDLDFSDDATRPEHCRFEENRLCLAKNIIHEGKPIGRIIIRSDLKAVKTRIHTFAGIVFVIFTLASFVSFLVSSFLQKMITQPILGLVETAREITEKKDYSVRAIKRSSDELGILTDALNNMLDEIDSREKALRKANESLEERVEQRTAELQKINADLRRAKDAADAASRAKSDFLANMSHEIRTPMNGVIAAGDLALAAENLPGNIRRYLEIINTSAHSLLRVIDDILDCSKIESGKMTLERQPFYLFDVLDRLVEIFISKAQEKHIELLLDIDPAVPSLMVGDALRLQQILTNLVSNALKFTRQGSVVIGISSEHKNDHLVVLTFYIKDTGPGIAPDRQQHLFEPFQQGDTSTTRKYGGTGLGLTIAGRLVEMMGGRIWLESEPGKGSTFYFTVTLVQRKSWQPEISPPDISGLKVLVVDDNPLCLEVIKRMFSPLDCRIFTATSGQEALEKIKEKAAGKEKIELVLLDWRLDGMDGLTLAALIRSQGINDIPIILMSAFGKAQELSRIDEAGIDIFLIKPIRRTDLLSALNTLVNENRLRGSGPGHADHSGRPPSLMGQRILVVEDNKTNQLVVKTILENSGMRVDIAQNGREAVEAVKTKEYDLILMDVQMPEMDGYEASKIIRSDPALAEIPIVAMTANALPTDRNKCLEAGMNEFLTKPISQAGLLRIIDKMISRTDSRAGRPEPDTGPPGAGMAATNIMNLPGIDTGEALVRLGISQSMFRHVLTSFAEDFADFLIKVQKSRDKNDQENVRKLIHKLKGSSGSIGARKLHDTASEIDLLCRKGIMPDQAQLNALETSLAEVLDSIAGIEESRDSSDGSDLQVSDRDNLVLALTELTEALDQALLENIHDSFNRVKEYAHGWEINDLGKLIAVYQYDEAEKKARQIMEKLDG